MNFRQFFIQNQWWGKLLGTFFGYLIGGAAGALFGLLIGNFFDRALVEFFKRPYWYYHVEKRETAQKLFFEATFSVMGHIAKSDGYVTQREIDMAKQLMEELGLNRKQKIMAQNLFTVGKAANFDLQAQLQPLKEVCRDNPDLLKLFMDIQYRIAQTEGLTEKKIQVLDKVLFYLGFAPLRDQYRFYEDFAPQGSRYDSSQQRANQRTYSYNRNRAHQAGFSAPPDPLAQAYAILELKRDATKQEVKRAYRRSISRNHPDRLIAQGLPEEMIKIANDKTQKITKAYELICTSRGW